MTLTVYVNKLTHGGYMGHFISAQPLGQVVGLETESALGQSITQSINHAL